MLIRVHPRLKNQSKAQQVKIKNPFFQNFFYPFNYNDLVKTSPLKIPQFSHQTRMFVQLWRDSLSYENLKSQIVNRKLGVTNAIRLIQINIHK